MKENTKDWVVGFSIGAAALSLFGIGFCVNRMNTMQEMLGASTEHIKSMSHVDIDKRMVDRLVEQSVKEQTSKVAQSAANRVVNDMANDIRNRVKQSVGNQTAKIHDKVSKALADEIAQMDKDEIIDDVVKATTDQLIEKLSDDLDNEVGRVGKIYKGIAAALQ